MCQFRALKKICGINDPTPTLLYAIPVDDVTTLPAPTTTVPTVYNTIATPPTLVAAKFWQIIQGRRKDIKFTDATKGEMDANQGREQRMAIFYPESNEESFYNASISLGSDVLVGWVNGSGKKLIWGTKENPVVVSKFDFDSSKGGWDIEFARDCGAAEVAPFYTGTFVTS